MTKEAGPRPRRITWRVEFGPRPPGTYLVDQPSAFRNKFAGRGTPRQQAFEQYKRWLMSLERRNFRNEARMLLRGRDLACRCSRGDKTCHAELLLRVANSKLEL
jgi:hypothetical protein